MSFASSHPPSHVAHPPHASPVAHHDMPPLSRTFASLRHIGQFGIYMALAIFAILTTYALTNTQTQVGSGGVRANEPTDECLNLIRVSIEPVRNEYSYADDSVTVVADRNNAPCSTVPVNVSIGIYLSGQVIASEPWRNINFQDLQGTKYIARIKLSDLNIEEDMWRDKAPDGKLGLHIKFKASNQNINDRSQIGIVLVKKATVSPAQCSTSFKFENIDSSGKVVPGENGGVHASVPIRISTVNTTTTNNQNVLMSVDGQNSEVAANGKEYSTIIPNLTTGNHTVQLTFDKGGLKCGESTTFLVQSPRATSTLVTPTATSAPTTTSPQTTSSACQLSLSTTSPKLGDTITVNISGNQIKDKNPKLFMYHGWDSTKGGALYQNFVTTGLTCGSSDSCAFAFPLKSELDKMSAAHIVDWSLNGSFDGAPTNMDGCRASLKVTDGVVLKSYSISTEGAVSGNLTQHITIPYMHNKALTIEAIIENPQLTNGKPIAAVDVYEAVWSGSGAQPTLKKGGIQAVGDQNGKFIFTIPPDSYNNSADSQIILYPATLDGNKAVRLLVTVEKFKCVPKNCSASGGKKYYYRSNQASTLLENGEYYSDEACTSKIDAVSAHCGPTDFHTGGQGAVVIPDRLWIKYEVKLEGDFAAGNKIAIAAKRHGGELLGCVGTLGYQDFRTTKGAQFVECRQGASMRTVIIKLVGQSEIRAWLAGSELLWGATKEGDPTANKSTGIHVVTGRAADGPISIVGNIQRTGETEQFVVIPVTVRK